MINSTSNVPKVVRIYSVFFLYLFSASLYAQNPLNTVWEAQNDSSSGSYDGPFVYVYIIGVIVTLFLVISRSSPLYDWAQKNLGKAYMLAIFAPAIVGFLAEVFA